jgi:hypothetical protein
VDNVNTTNEGKFPREKFLRGEKAIRRALIVILSEAKDLA